MNLEGNYTNLERESLFFDSYAFFEILRENRNYERYKDFEIVTTKLNLFELYLGILRESNEKNAQIVLDKYYPFVVDFDENVIRNAAKLKHSLNKRDISMTDCMGYSLAKQLGIKFLTGDDAFRDLDNVEFVK